MKVNKMAKEELEILSYADLTELILKESKKGLKTPDIFKKICKLLELTEEEYNNQIGDYYTSLTTDKRFVFLNGVWDLKERHTSNIVIENDDDEDDEEEEDDSIVETVESEDIDEMEDEEGIDQDDDDMGDLNIISDDEMEDDE